MGQVRKLRDLASWYREYAERAGNAAISDLRLRTAEDLERKALELEKRQREPTRIDPALPSTRSSRTTTVEHLKYQLTGLVEGRYMLNRLIDVAKDRLETGWNGLTPQDVGELDGWLRSQVGASKAEARLRWGFIRGILDTIREARGSN
jgi:hypothetical protein